MAQSPQPPSPADNNAPGETARSDAPARKKVLVVGATGFLGAKILRTLALDESSAVVAMSRKGAPLEGGAGIEWVRGDMIDPASLDRALQGVDVASLQPTWLPGHRKAAGAFGSRCLTRLV